MQKSATAGAELLKILRGDRFDPVRAAQLVQGCALNTPLLDENGYKTTYLNEAVQEKSFGSRAISAGAWCRPELFR